VKHEKFTENMIVASAAKGSLGAAPSQAEIQKHLAKINELQRQRGKPELTADDVLIRPMRMVGTKVTSIFTKFEKEDLEKMVGQVPGKALLIGHNYEMAPIGTFFAAKVVEDGGEHWIDGWFYVLNDEEGRKLVEKIDKGIYNEASITWFYDKAICSICGGDYFGLEPNEDGEYCPHMRGFEYDGEVCYIRTTGNLKFVEASIVYKGAHPDTKVGGLLAAAAAEHGAKTIEEVDEMKKGRMEKAYVPPNPPGYGLDNRSDWTRPTFEQFLDAMDLPRDTRWEDLSAAQRRWVASHFAWAPSRNTEEYTFSDLKLPHHIPTERYPNSVVKWGGVRAAAQRLPTADVPEDEVPAIQRHLAEHYHEFGRKAPWERDAASWERYVEVARLLASGYVESELLDEASALVKRLFADDEEEKEVEVMELTVKLGEDVITVEGDREKLEAELNKAFAELVEAMQAKLNEQADKAAKVDELEAKLAELEAKLADLEPKAKLGEQYVKDLVEEVKRLFVASEGVENAEGYAKMVEAMAERGEIDALKAERERLQKKLEELPNERLSQDVEEGPINDIPPKLDAFRQR